MSSLTTPPSSAPLTFTPVSDLPFLRVHGRTKDGADPLPLFWNNSGIEFCTDASEVWVEIETDSGFHEPWVAFDLNGSLMSRQMLLPGTTQVCLFRSMTKGVRKTGDFYRELQAMGEDERCHVLVRGLWSDGEFFALPEKRCRIEFIGDSITSGEGTYGAVQDTDWLAMYMSSSRQYASLVGKALQADIRLISQGGWGVYCGWDNDPRHRIPAIYGKICGLATGAANEALGAQEMYDFAWQPDVIVINLGTNDSSGFNTPPFTVPTGEAAYVFCGDPEKVPDYAGRTFKLRRDAAGARLQEDEQKIEDAAVDFLYMLRRHNPNAHLLWAYGMLGYDLTPVLAGAVRRYQRESGDMNSAFINLPDTRPDEYGAHMHPGAASHARAALVLEDYIRRLPTLAGKL